jgi:hypothetical protein
MPTHQSPRKQLPPLATGTAYVASDFERFDYFGALLAGGKPILRLHLKNETTLDLPTTDDELRHLLLILCEAFPTVAMSRLKERGMI